MMKKIVFQLALMAVAAVASNQVCPQIGLDIEQDTCRNPGEFNKAFKDVYAAVYHYVDWENYYGRPPTQTLAILAETSFEAVQEASYPDSTSTVVHGNNGGGGYAARQGDGNSGRRFLEEEFLEVMEGRRNQNGRELYNCVAPSKCVRWCCWFCPCARRRLLEDVRVPSNPAIVREAARLEEAAIAEAHGALSFPEQRKLQHSSVCEWLADQEFPGCLRGAVMGCSVS